MTYKPARLTDSACRDIAKAAGANHAAMWRGLVGYDEKARMAIASDGSRRKMHPAEVVMATSCKFDGATVEVEFGDHIAFHAFKPSWLKA